MPKTAQPMTAKLLPLRRRLRNLPPLALPGLIGCLLTGCLLTVLSGCLFSTNDPNNGRVAGGAEDFPNTVAMGAAMSDHVSDHTGWDQFSVIPSALPSFKEADSLVVAPDTASPILAKQAAAPALGKAAAGQAKLLGSAKDTVTWDLSDTATLKVARRFHVLDGLLKIHRDTTVFRYDAKAKDAIAGNELILLSKGADVFKISGRVQAYRYENLDSAGGFDRAVFYDRIPLANSAFRNNLLVMLPGPDGDIATKEDNRPAFYSSTLLRPAADGSGGTDTTEFFSISDADGDGALWGDGDSGVVDFKQKTPKPLFRPTVDLVVQKMRAVLYKDEQKTYPISYSETRTENDGKKVVFSVKGTRADSSFGPGDTTWVSVHTDFPAGSRLVEKHSRYKVVLGGQPKRYQDNKLLKYTLSATWNLDSLTTTSFTLTPDQPVFSKNLDITGDLSVDLGFPDGATGIAVGRFQDKHIDVDFTRRSREGKERRFHIRWDAFGKILSQIRLD